MQAIRAGNNAWRGVLAVFVISALAVAGLFSGGVAMAAGHRSHVREAATPEVVNVASPAPGTVTKVIPDGNTNKCLAKPIAELKKEYRTERPANSPSLATMIATLKANALPCTNGINFGLSKATTVVVPANVANAMMTEAEANPQYKKALAKEEKQSKVHADGFAPFIWASFTTWGCDGGGDCYVKPGDANWAEEFTTTYAYDGFFVVGGGGWPGTYTSTWHANLPLWSISGENAYYVWNVGVAFTHTPYILGRDDFNVNVGAFWFNYSWQMRLWHNDYINGSEANGMDGGAW